MKPRVAVDGRELPPALPLNQMAPPLPGAGGTGGQGVEASYSFEDQSPVFRSARLQAAGFRCSGGQGLPSPRDSPSLALTSPLAIVSAARAPRAGACSCELASPQQRRLDELGETLRRREAESRELRGVISMKDDIIRTLGVHLGAAEAAAEVVHTKDDIIRGLSLELGVAQENLARTRDADEPVRGPPFADMRCELAAARGVLESRELDLLRARAQLQEAFVDEIDNAKAAARALETATTAAVNAAVPPRLTIPAASASPIDGCAGRGSSSGADVVRCGTLLASTATTHEDTQGFTVVPVSGEDASYHCVAGDALDERIAQFCASRPSTILFTRVDAHGRYLYGRHTVYCTLAESCRDGVLVSLIATGDRVETADTHSAALSIGAFVVRWEAVEYSFFDALYGKAPSATVGKTSASPASVLSFFA